MNKAFKTLIFKIAKLPVKDQQWLVKQLTAKQQEQFDRFNGSDLLANAHGFCSQQKAQQTVVKSTIKLPIYCEQLANYPKFYIAIILQQGQFSWQDGFLEKNQLNELLLDNNEKLANIKPATKALVFKKWQAELSFSDHLEQTDG